VVRVLLFENGDRAFAADRINSLIGFVAEHVITITDRGKALDGFSRSRIKDEQTRRVSGDDEQSLVGLVDSHRIIRQHHPERPCGEDRARGSDEIVFTRGTTEAINLVASSWGGANLGRGDEILITVSDHYSSLVPWQLEARRTGATTKPSSSRLRKRLRF
jgi:Aminotransferase class-V